MSKATKYPLTKTAPVQYEYYINSDERGEFYADVRTPGGKTVFEISGFEIFDDGYMSHSKDLVGLKDYLTDMDIMRTCDWLVSGQ